MRRVLAVAGLALASFIASTLWLGHLRKVAVLGERARVAESTAVSLQAQARAMAQRETALAARYDSVLRLRAVSRERVVRLLRIDTVPGRPDTVPVLVPGPVVREFVERADSAQAACAALLESCQVSRALLDSSSTAALRAVKLTPRPSGWRNQAKLIAVGLVSLWLGGVFW